MHTLLKPVIDLIFPDLCVNCKREVKIDDHLFCVSCLSALPFTGFEKQESNTFIDHFNTEIELEYGIALFYLNPGSGIAEVIHQLKYHGESHLGVQLGKVTGEILLNNQFGKVFDVVVPVPLHKKKEKQRGYNQSERIASGLGKKLGIPVGRELLARTRYTVTQTRLNRIERLKNTQDAFQTESKLIKNYDHILLVDDVLTTGATLTGCAMALKKAGAGKISMLTIAIGN